MLDRLHTPPQSSGWWERISTFQPDFAPTAFSVFANHSFCASDTYSFSLFSAVFRQITRSFLLSKSR